MPAAQAGSFAHDVQVPVVASQVPEPQRPVSTHDAHLPEAASHVPEAHCASSAHGVQTETSSLGSQCLEVQLASVEHERTRSNVRTPR